MADILGKSTQDVEQHYLTPFERTAYHSAKTMIDKVNSENAKGDSEWLHLRNYVWRPIPKEMLLSFAYHRIQEKRDEGQHPRLTSAQIAGLRRNDRFMSHFILFLQNWRLMSFLTAIENDIVNASRGPKTDSGPALPNLNPVIRSANRRFVKDSDQQKLYGQIENVFQLLDSDPDIGADHAVKAVFDSMSGGSDDLYRYKYYKYRSKCAQLFDMAFDKLD